MIQNIWALKGSSLLRQKLRAKVIANYLDLKANDFVLDIGCAEGFITSYLLKAYFIAGVDKSKSSLLIAKKKVIKSNADFILADANALPFQSSSFDKVVVPEVFEHLPEEAQYVLCRETERVLKKGKTLVVSVPYKEQIQYTYCIHCGKSTPIWGHLDSFDEEELLNLLQNFSFVTYCYLPNLRVITLSRIIQHLPFRIWLMLNNLLGLIRKGYWIVIKCKNRKAWN